jgi:hypothetical protein
MTKLQITYTIQEVEHIIKQHIHELHKVPLIKRGAFAISDVYDIDFNWAWIEPSEKLIVTIDSEKVAKETRGQPSPFQITGGEE